MPEWREKLMKLRSMGVLAGIAFVGAAAQAAPVPLTINNVANQSSVTGGLVGLDISGVVTGLSSSNSLTQNFTGPGGAYTGTLTAEVFGNVGAPGGGLNTVVIVYTFTGNGPSGIEKFAFGGAGNALDLNDLANATHGNIADGTSAGQTADSVTLLDNSSVPAADTFNFNSDNLGGVGSTETYSWYVMTDGNVQIGKTQVEVTNFGAVTFDMLTLVDIPGQPDLGIVPLPSAAGLGLAGMAIIGVRRRR